MFNHCLEIFDVVHWTFMLEIYFTLHVVIIDVVTVCSESSVESCESVNFLIG